MITLGESFDLFLETLKHSNSSTLSLSDIEIENYLLEEFAIEAPAYLSQFTLERLENEGIIDSEIVNKSRQLQNRYLSMDAMKQWNANSIKSSKEWHEIFILSDEIIKMVHAKWTDDEISYLKSI